MTAVPLPRLVLYARTSTDDNQAPEDSLLWQRRSGDSLVAGRAEIVRVAHDIDVSRSISWSHRPEASRLIAEMADPRRDWDGIAIGEVSRAFGDGAQYHELAALMEYYGVSLWAPEVSGPVDFESDAHEIIMNVKGSMSKSERRQLSKRVAGGMAAMAQTGDRFLGGRPPFGYRLISTGVPHPQREKARNGIELRRLDIHPDTAPVVVAIYQMRLDGLGYRAIAKRLDGQGIASPSAADPDRNSHRRQSGWAVSVVQSICANDRYMGVATWGTTEKIERLRDPKAWAEGKKTRQVRRDAPLASVEGAVPGIVSPETWYAVREMAKRNTRPGAARPGARGSGRHYALTGMLTCAHCGRTLGAETRTHRSGNEAARYVCRLRDQYPGQGNGHPKKLAINEAPLVELIDAWLAEVLTAEALDARAVEMTATTPLDRRTKDDLRRLRTELTAAKARLDHAYDLREDPDFPQDRAKATVARRKAELVAAQSALSDATAAHTPEWSPETLRAALNHLGDVGPALLAAAEPAERQRIYAELGLGLTIARVDEGWEVQGVLAPNVLAPVRGARLRVGGGT